jgi:hypothetical protein
MALRFTLCSLTVGCRSRFAGRHVDTDDPAVRDACVGSPEVVEHKDPKTERLKPFDQREFELLPRLLLRVFRVESSNSLPVAPGSSARRWSADP